MNSTITPYKLLLEQYVEDIASITENFTRTFHLLYRDRSDFLSENLDDLEYCCEDIGTSVAHYTSSLADRDLWKGFKNESMIIEDVITTLQKIRKMEKPLDI